MNHPIRIKQLTDLPPGYADEWGHNGYISGHQYEVKKTITGSTVSFRLEATALTTPYSKHWQVSTDDLVHYQQLVAAGHCFGAYDGSTLIGIALAEARSWNNTLYIENILVSEAYRSQAIGAMLIQYLAAHRTDKQFRHLELETQNTNWPAISFYTKQGFSITGFNLSVYGEDIPKEEWAIYMIL